MEYQTLTRCPNCLDLSLDRTEGCITNHAGDRDARARRLLHSKGYIISEGMLVYVENDDPDDYRLITMAEAPDPVDAYLYLESAGWPQAPDWSCPSCGEGLVSAIGEICAFCSRENDEAERAGV